ncbi:hypothetical protein DMUE_4636 [Dictyocoela muelleri]|nr:hypothetical protein DMUE_4636 [Dictyocoela muelleri]
MELIDLSEDRITISLFNKKEDTLIIWKNAVEFLKLSEHAQKMLSCFSTTYCLESTFSNLSKIKISLRSQITDIHLEDQLKLRTSKLIPDIKKLALKKIRIVTKKF